MMIVRETQSLTYNQFGSINRTMMKTTRNLILHWVMWFCIELLLTFHEDLKSLVQGISWVVWCDNFLYEWLFEDQSIFVEDQRKHMNWWHMYLVDPHKKLLQRGPTLVGFETTNPTQTIYKFLNLDQTKLKLITSLSHSFTIQFGSKRIIAHS